KRLDAMVEDYHRDGGFIDWARNRLKETDESTEVQKAFDLILKSVDERAIAFENSFALQLQEWIRDENQSDRLSLIENVLGDVVIPIAKQQPLLMLVLDGMSVAVFRQLLQDILRHDWTEIANEEKGYPRPVLATLPSVTSISRRALFLGKLDPGINGTEEGEFKKNDLLFQGSGSQVRPQLFKMGDLSDEGQGGIAAKVCDAIADKRCRVVSVVINAIDDHLDSGKQVDFTWTRSAIRGLRDLLRQASEAGRLVLMTSDHGHVLDFGTKQLPSAKDGRGDRFRSTGGKTEEGEMEFEGSRIYKATGNNRVTLACSASVRYGKDKRGYHGGANPQEMVVPFAVLSNVRTEVPSGWKEIPSFQPAWWRIDSSRVVPIAASMAKSEEVVQGLELFERVAPKGDGTPSWIDGLLASPIYIEQSKLAVRGAPSCELMTRLLTGLNTRGGTAVKQALAQELSMPPFRLDGLIQNVSRILNVDGYEVITFDRASEKITLNVELLRTQFDLKK
ncbi:MAG: BREX-2 system phosphatase PglZ, partial [Verrucomicrobiota bacterium]